MRPRGSIIYVNGDNNLENLRQPDQTWKVRLIKEDFKRLMFDSKGAGRNASRKK